MKIIEANETHYEDVCSMFKELDGYHASIAPKRVSEYEGVSRSREKYEFYICGEDRVVFLVQEDKCIVGFVNLIINSVQGSKLHTERSYTLLDNIYILERCRKKGLASALLAAGEKWSSDKGIRTIELQLYTANQRALEFYQAKGYGQFMARMERNLNA